MFRSNDPVRILFVVLQNPERLRGSEKDRNRLTMIEMTEVSMHVINMTGGDHGLSRRRSLAPRTGTVNLGCWQHVSAPRHLANSARL
jgi:hypothetical protein